MEIASNVPVRTASLLWQPGAGTYVLSIICKATFRLVPGVVELDVEQENPNEEDNYWDDDPTRSLYAPSDLVPYKTSADVLLVGYAFAPRGNPARSLVARLVVGTVDKSIEVWADRSWANDGSLREGPRYARMPLRYERAAGGPDTPNPVGLRSQVTDAHGAMTIPNLQPPGMFLSQRGEWMAPIGFGPIAPTWPNRMSKLGPNVAAKGGGLRYDLPLPVAFDPRFFNSAPEDQQMPTIRPNERIVLENLHPDHSRLVTSLPGFTLRALWQRSGSADKDVSLDCDTLWIDTNSGRCTVVWRGRIPLNHPAENGRITITTAEPGAGAGRMSRPSQPALDEMDDNISMTHTHIGGSAAQPSVLPFLQRMAPVAAPAPVPGPFAAPFPGVSPRPTTPFPSSPVPPPVPPPVPAAVPQAPPMAVSAASPASPWAVGFGAPGSSPKPAPVPLGVASASTAAAAASASAERVERAPEPIVPRAVPAPAASASSPAREAMTMLWFDENRADDMTACPQWIQLLSESDVTKEAETKKQDDESDEDDDYFGPKEEEVEEDEPESVKKRKRVAKILARGEPSNGPELALAVADAVTKHGTLDPPIMLAGGELSFPFDAWETVEALVIAATAAAVGDKKLKEVLDGVQETAKMPGIKRSTSIAEALATRVREAFVQTNRQVGPGWLDAQAERMLVEGRCHQKRTVLGQTFLRCLLHTPGAEEGIPTYVPEALSKTIPLVVRMRARVIVEVHAQQDQYETYPRALRVLALARMVDLGVVKGR